MKTITGIFLLLGAVSCHLLADNSIPLTTAVENSLIRVAIEGNSGHTGKCLSFRAKNLTAKPLKISVSSGLKLACKDSAYQDMIVTQSFQFTAVPEKIFQQEIYAMCGEKYDMGPHKSIMYKADKMVAGNLLAAVKIIEEEKLQNNTGQYVVWTFTDHLSEQELESSLGKTEFLKAKKILAEIKENKKNDVPKRKKTRIIYREHKCIWDGAMLFSPAENKNNAAEKMDRKLIIAYSEMEENTNRVRRRKNG